MADWPVATATLSALSGPTATAANLIPADCWLLGVTIQVVTTVVGPTGIDVGDAEDPQRFATAASPTTGTTTTLADHRAFTIPAYGAPADVILTAVGGNFTGVGSVIIRAFYMTLTAGFRGLPWLTVTDTLSGLSGTSATSNGLIPAGAWLIGVRAEVTTTVTGGGGFTGFDVGDAEYPTLWGDNISPLDGTMTDISDFDTTQPPLYTPSGDVVLRARGASFTGGAVQLTVYYATLSHGWRTRSTDVSLPLFAASGVLDPGEWVIGVQAEVLNTLTGATGLDVGDQEAVSLWASNAPVTAGSLTDMDDFLVTTPVHYPLGGDVVLRPVDWIQDDPTFTGGTARVTVSFTDLSIGVVTLIAAYRRRRAA